MGSHGGKLGHVKELGSLDPLLRGLTSITDGDSVARRFRGIWAEQGGPSEILSCARHGTRYAPGVRCVVTYELTGRSLDGREQRSVGVIDIKPSGVAFRLWYDDPVLRRTLRRALNADLMRARFASVVSTAEHERTVDGADSQISPVRYKPERSCVLRYGFEDRAFFGKVLAQGDAALFKTIAALFEASRDEPEMPSVARPVAHWNDLNMVVQEAIAEGRSLRTVLFAATTASADGLEWMHRAGVSIAALHRCAKVAGPTRAFDDDAAELRSYETLFGHLIPELEHPYRDAVATATKLAGGRVPPARVASHGALRTDQLLTDGERIIAIDLDGFCWSSPARDVGNLLAYLEWKAIREPHHAALLNDYRSAFLNGYNSLGARPDATWLRLQRAASMLKIAGRRLHSLTVEEWTLLPSLIDEARAALSGRGP